ncbi:MAG: phosphatase PAP2 family protein, partial [Dehalococcoidia bacterium]
IRLTAVAMSVVMWWAIVVTGNHYFFDMLMGGAVVGFAWTLVWTLGRYRVAQWLLGRCHALLPARLSP